MITQVLWLSKRDALRMGFDWNSAGGGGKSGLHAFINIYDYYIPDETRQTYAKIKNIDIRRLVFEPVTMEMPGMVSEPTTMDKIHMSPEPMEPSRAVQGVATPPEPLEAALNREYDAITYSGKRDYERRQADKYVKILDAAGARKGRELKDWIPVWNAENPGFKTSYSRLMAAKKKKTEGGVIPLLAKTGKREGHTIVKDEWFECFKGLYLKESRPSVASCREQTLSFAMKADPAVTEKNFPGGWAFMHRLEREIPEETIYFYRYGKAKHNRKYHSYIERNYDNLKAGDWYVADHAQIDVAVMLESGKVVFPWITAWRDFKSGKWVGWLNHPEAPNSDHIFQSFYYAVRDFGLPTDAYMDNGKDYRCKDFAGGRKHGKISIDEDNSRTILDIFNIKPHFALPYNGQTKPIERDFLTVKERFSKQMPGYRGGSVAERPEGLKDEIKDGAILKWDEYTKHIDNFIINKLNKMPSEGKNLQGKSRDEGWAAEFTQKRVASKDSMKFFMMRTTNDLTIGRNGIKDSKFGVTYWGEWMSGMKGEKVYMRRDIKDHAEAYVFNALNNEFLGMARIGVFTVPAFAETPIEKAQLASALAVKNQNLKIVKAQAGKLEKTTADIIIGNMTRTTAGDCDDGPESNILEPIKTQMDDIAVKRKKDKERDEGSATVSKIAWPKPIELFHAGLAVSDEP
ncbi:MAG: Mu transposase C-terminal domain-containing protein, partial [Nitrospirae bacterium]|nr:Mu transposase C-terminal domain-containing protein [Nitrospirota bacterium]